MQNKKENNAPIKRMADLLMQGATLTDLACPVCASPLFRLRDGTLWCGKDEKKVIIVKEGEKAPEPPKEDAYGKLEDTLLKKIANLQTKIEKTEDPDELQKLSSTLSKLLTSLEQTQKLKKA